MSPPLIIFFICAKILCQKPNRRCSFWLTLHLAPVFSHLCLYHQRDRKLHGSFHFLFDYFENVELSESLNLRNLARRSLNSIDARIWTIPILYNAVKILEMKYDGEMEKFQDKMREKGERSYLSGSALIVYGRDKYYRIFSGVKYANLVAIFNAKKRNREIARELEKMLVEKLSKKKITEFIKRLKEE